MDALLDLVSQQECVGCQAPAAVICPDCRAAAGPPVIATLPGIGPVASASSHQGPWAKAVSHYKDGGRRGLAGPLSEQLTRAVAIALLGCGWRPGTPVLLVAIPTRAQARRERGGDTLAELVARSARQLRRAGVPARRAALLAPARVTTDQVGLSGPSRRANMVGAFTCRPAPPGQIVLVDDVVTTGATLAAAARAVRAAQTRHRRAASAPSGARRRPPVAATITSAHLRHPSG